MDPSVVGSAQFGQLWASKLPGNYRGNLEQIFSQPLVYTLDDGIQYVFIATTQNNVYKINAKTGNIVASRSLHIPFLSSDIVPCTDISPYVGVTVRFRPTCSGVADLGRLLVSLTQLPILGISPQRLMMIRPTRSRVLQMAAISSTPLT